MKLECSNKPVVSCKELCTPVNSAVLEDPPTSINLLGTNRGGGGGGGVPGDGLTLVGGVGVLVTGGGVGVVRNHSREGGHGGSFTLLHCAEGAWGGGVVLEVLLLRVLRCIITKLI